MQILYARSMWLRNCGRFTHVSSDFGSRYHTHIFVTGEALYASLTRATSWRHSCRFVDLEDDARKSSSADYFLCDYDISKKPIWFTPGIFLDTDGEPITKQHHLVDTNDFNVISEGYPSTGGDLRPSYVPTYGCIESILPDHRMFAYAISPYRTELEQFKPEQTYLLGKKRTMFQLTDLSNIITGQIRHGSCNTWWLEIKNHEIPKFTQYRILAVTLRYFICRGLTIENEDYWEFAFPNGIFNLPNFYLSHIPAFDTAGK